MKRLIKNYIQMPDIIMKTTPLYNPLNSKLPKNKQFDKSDEKSYSKWFNDQSHKKVNK